MLMRLLKQKQIKTVLQMLYIGKIILFVKIYIYNE
jgi:hypothetical protein